jgi:hypothetical protein
LFAEAGLGVALLALSQQLAAQGVVNGTILGTLIVLVNAVFVVRIAGANRLSERGLALTLGGAVLGGEMACLGAILAAESPYWLVLVAAGVLWNMEVAFLATIYSCAPVSETANPDGESLRDGCQA